MSDHTEPVPHADRDHSEQPKYCRTCGYGGWYGSRWHDPKHHAPHIHCTDCETPCRACATGDGFVGALTPGTAQKAAGEPGTPRPEIARESGEERVRAYAEALWRGARVAQGEAAALAAIAVADAEQEALRAERDSLRAALDDRNRLWGHRSRELGDLRAEVERLRREQDGIGCSRFTCADDLGRMRSRAEKAEVERDRLAAALRDMEIERNALRISLDGVLGEADRLAGVVERVRAATDALTIAAQIEDRGGEAHAATLLRAVRTGLLAILDADAPEASERLHGPGCADCDGGVTEFHRSRSDVPNPVRTPAPEASEDLLAEAPSTCLVPVWDDGIYRVRCSRGTAGVCGKHGPHQPHPSDGRTCDPMDDGYCRTHGVYVDPDAPEASEEGRRG